jgi:hypothetical protein
MAIILSILFTRGQSTTSPEPGPDVVVTVSGSSVVREVAPGVDIR